MKECKHIYNALCGYYPEERFDLDVIAHNPYFDQSMADILGDMLANSAMESIESHILGKFPDIGENIAWKRYDQIEPMRSDCLLWGAEVWLHHPLRVV